jgi:outer membrane murein-binding lipoprotein Lpp
MISAISVASVFSSCSNKTVDEKINDMVQDKQETVDELNEEMDALTIELETAEKELAKAKRKKAAK